MSTVNVVNESPGATVSVESESWTIEISEVGLPGPAGPEANVTDDLALLYLISKL